jgi:hypothetical protein
MQRSGSPSVSQGGIHEAASCGLADRRGCIVGKCCGDTGRDQSSRAIRHTAACGRSQVQLALPPRGHCRQAQVPWLGAVLREAEREHLPAAWLHLQAGERRPSPSTPPLDGLALPAATEASAGCDAQSRQARRECERRAPRSEAQRRAQGRCDDAKPCRHRPLLRLAAWPPILTYPTSAEQPAGIRLAATAVVARRTRKVSRIPVGGSTCLLQGPRAARSLSR